MSELWLFTLYIIVSIIHFVEKKTHTFLDTLPPYSSIESQRMQHSCSNIINAITDSFFSDPPPPYSSIERRRKRRFCSNIINSITLFFVQICSIFGQIFGA